MVDSKKPGSERLAHAWIFVDKAVRRSVLTYFGCGIVVADENYFVTRTASGVVEGIAGEAGCLWLAMPNLAEDKQGIEERKERIVAKEV